MTKTLLQTIFTKSLSIEFVEGNSKALMES